MVHTGNEMSANDQWFYSGAQNQQLGPVTFQQLQQIIGAGQITESTLIWNQNMTNWTPAGQVPGVFNATVQAAAPAQITPVAQAAPISNNPYAAPAVAPFGGAPSGGSFPTPFVKRCSYGMFITFYILGILLLIVGFVAFLGNIISEASSQSDYGTNPQPFDFSAISPVGILLMLAGVVCLIISTVLSLIYLYRGWLILQPGGARTSPGKAVGFLFIPFFNFYWVFVSFLGWSQDWNRIRTSHSNLTHLPASADGVFMALAICFVCSFLPLPIIGSLIAIAYGVLSLIAVYKVCSVVNAVAETQQQR